jgi:hypothetical protein
VEQAAFERAVIGWEEPIVHEGRVVAYRRRYSDGLLRALLGEALRPGGALRRKAAAKRQDELEDEAHAAATAAGGEFSLPRELEDVRAAILRRIETIERHEARQAALAATGEEA